MCDFWIHAGRKHRQSDNTFTFSPSMLGMFRKHMGVFVAIKLFGT